MTRRRKILRGFLLLLLAGITYMVAQLFWPSPRIVVSKETTWLTQPLADDGLPDYAAYLLEQGREGVTPENNGAVPYLQAMWPADLQAKRQQPLCEYLGMEVPERPGMFNPLESEDFQERTRGWLQEMTPDTEAVEEEEVPEEIDGGGEDVEESYEELGEGEIEFDDEWVAETSTGERMEELFAAVENRPWRREEFGPLAEWIDEHAGEYDLLHEAARRPRFYLPSPSFIVDPGDVLVYTETPAMGMGDAARCLALRGRLALGEGDVAAAWKDCEAMYRLAAQVPDSSIVALLVGTGTEFGARELYLSLLESPSLTPEVARAMVTFQAQRPKGRDLHGAIEPYERLCFLSAMMVYSGQRHGGVEFDEAVGEYNPAKLPINVAVDWNTPMRMGNEWFDKLNRIAQMTDRRARSQAIEEWSDGLDRIKAKFPMNIPPAVVSRRGRNVYMGEQMVTLLLLVVHAPFMIEDRSTAYAHLDPVAAALAVHRLEQGEYPESLDELVPNTLSAAPIDSYGNPVAYRRTDNGYIVYSTGVNGIDDRGTNAFLIEFEGYAIDRDDEEVARALLGLDPLMDDSEQEDADRGEDNLANRSLWDQISRDDDDFAIRLPTLNSQLYQATPAEE